MSYCDCLGGHKTVSCVIIFSNWTLCCFVVLFKSGKTYVLVDLVEGGNMINLAK